MGGVWGNTGRNRSKFGKFLDDNRISQREFTSYCRINRDTVSKACNEDNVSELSKRKLLEGLKKLTGKEYKASDFW